MAAEFLQGDELFALDREPFGCPVRPVPWNMQWYFQLPKTSLDCLADAKSVSLETHGPNGAPERFTVEGKELISLKEFGSH